MGPITSRSGYRHKIVCLDAFLCPVPKFNFPHDYTEHANTIGDDLVQERVKDATIIISTRVPLTAETLTHCPNLEFVAVMGAGTNFVDTAACRKRNIPVCNCPGASAEAVAEHAFALYFASKKKIVDLHNTIVEGKKWPEVIGGFRFYETPPRVARHDTVGIIGYGGLGRNIESIANALGMKVMLAERKSVPDAQIRPGRRPFTEVIQKSTVVMIGCPLNDETRDMINTAELQQMRSDSILINVARGGVINEDALVKALQENWIGAAATDVFDVEPATYENNVLIRHLPPNLTMSPHTAWYADASIEGLQSMIKTVIEGYVAGELHNVVN